MKNNLRNIFSLTFFITIISKVICQEIRRVGSTIYYSRNRKCAIYYENIEICLDNGTLIVKTQPQNEKKIELTDYSETNYYELNLYKNNSEDINVIITYFLNTSELIFKYYHININNIDDYNQTDYTYYNESLNPINKGINCQARDGVYQFICFYLNKYKEVVQMDINPIDNTHYVSVEFQFAKIKNPDDLDSKKTVIMSSLFKNKYKYYYHSENDKFFIHMKKRGSFDFSSSSINNIDNFELNQNDGHIYYIFAVFKQNSINYVTLHWNSNNIKAFIRNSDDSEAECNLYNLYSSDLIFIEGINIYFLRTNNKIIEDFEFEYEEKSDNTNTIPIFNEGKENTNTIIIPDTNPNQNTLNEINILKLDKTKEEILQDINTIMKDVNIEETYEYTTKGFN